MLFFLGCLMGTAQAAETLDELKAKAAQALAKQDFQRALTLLEAAYALDPQPGLEANIGFVHYRLGNLGKAAAALERFLATRPTPAKARKARELVDRLKPRIQLTSDPSGATVVAADGASQGLTPLTVRLLVGEHTFTLKKPEHSPVEVSVRVREGRRDTVHRTLMRTRRKPKLAEVFVKPAPVKSKPVSPWAWVALSGAVLAGAGAGGLYFMTDDAIASRDAARRGTAWDGHQSDAELYHTGMWASAGLAVVSGALSAWLFSR
jgi:tetratricopeptide (TPR) repeat protein